MGAWRSTVAVHASEDTPAEHAPGPSSKGGARLAEPLIAGSLRRQMEANLPVLKGMLEDQTIG